MKSQIIERLGQSDILLPSLIAEGLSANDRAKVHLSILQAVSRHARNPTGVRFDLTEECRAVHLDPVAMEALVNRAELLAGERMNAPGLGKLGNAIWQDLASMIRAVKAGDSIQGAAALERLSAIRATSSLGSSDVIEMAEVAKLTGLSNRDVDGLHRLIMDLHKNLNSLSAAHAEELIEGAHAYGLLPQDRPALAAFMRGLQTTCRLKFDHPGLATTATRCGARFTIQNDIGETDAHVVVITVDQDAVIVTYTDVHLARARFFTGLFRDFAVEWSGLDRKSGNGLGDESAFYLVTGRYSTGENKPRDSFLEAIGASLVFLIDWNKARKVLRVWVSKADAVHILDWAARHRFGHRGFLELGGSELIASAVHHAAPTRIGFGERLDSALGRDAAIDFLKTVMRISAESLLQGGSVRLARDRIEADLIRHLQRVDTMLLAVVVRQAGLARQIAVGIAHLVSNQQAARPFDRAAMALQARRIEEKADRIAIEARAEIVRFDASPAIERLVNRMEDAIDELEQAAFVASLIPDEVASHVLKPLAELCAVAISGTEAAAAGTAAAADVPEGQRVDSENVLAAVSRLIEAEHNADAAERAVMEIILRGEFDLRTSLSVLELARSLERATDRLASFGHLLRQRVLEDLAS